MRSALVLLIAVLFASASLAIGVAGDFLPIGPWLSHGFAWAVGAGTVLWALPWVTDRVREASA